MIYVGDEVLDRADLTVGVRALIAVLRAGRRVGQAAVVAELAEQPFEAAVRGGQEAV